MGIKDLLKITKGVLGINSKSKKDELKSAEIGSRRRGVDVSVLMHILVFR
jgi:hypothetical protein